MHPPDPVMLAGTFIPLLSIFLGGLLLIIPVAGLTLRFAMKPALDALAHLKELQGSSEETRLLEQRLALLEQQLQSGAILRILEDGQMHPSGAAEVTSSPLPGLLGVGKGETEWSGYPGEILPHFHSAR